MANYYAQGRKFEYEVKKYFEKQGCFVFRIAGSHSPFDLIATTKMGSYFIQCKYNSSGMTEKEINELKEAAKNILPFNAIPVLATRKKGKKLKLRYID